MRDKILGVIQRYVVDCQLAPKELADKICKLVEDEKADSITTLSAKVINGLVIQIKVLKRALEKACEWDCFIEATKKEMQEEFIKQAEEDLRNE